MSAERATDVGGSTNPGRRLEPGEEHRVSPLELFFDLVFVFAITQVTSLLTHSPTWGGVLRGMLVLAAIWWAWNSYAYLTSAIDVDEGGVRLAMFAAMAAMLFVALAVPGAFDDDGAVFGFAYLAVRLLHLVLSAIVGRRHPARHEALLRFAPTAILGSTLLVVAGFLEGDARVALWMIALTIDYGGPALIGIGGGWHIAPEHFAERYGLVVIIALGESVIAIGVGAGLELSIGVLAAAALGIAVICALWWLYFDVAAIFARRRLAEATGLARAQLARDAYTYAHLVMIAGIVLFAFGLETTLEHVDEALETVPAVGLCAGTAFYLAGLVAFLFRATGYLFRRRTLAAAVLIALIPVATALPALPALALVSAVCALVVAYEAIRHREPRFELRHPEVAA